MRWSLQMLAVALLLWGVLGCQPERSEAPPGEENYMAMNLTPEEFREKWNDYLERADVAGVIGKYRIEELYVESGEEEYDYVSPYFSHAFDERHGLFGETDPGEGMLRSVTLYGVPRTGPHLAETVFLSGLLIATVNPDLDLDETDRVLDKLGVSTEELVEGIRGSVSVGEIKYTVTLVLTEGEFQLRAEGTNKR